MYIVQTEGIESDDEDEIEEATSSSNFTLNITSMQDDTLTF